MQKIIDLQIKRMGVHGVGAKSDLHDTIFDSFEDNVAHTVVRWKDKDIGVHFVDSRIRSEIREATVISRIENHMSIGDYIFKDNGETWLCFDRDESTIKKYIFKKCNNNLKWQDDEGKIHEYGCIMLDRTSVYSDGLSKTIDLFLQEDQLMAILPKDVLSLDIGLEKRFVISGRVYSLLRIDEVSSMGLATLRFKADGYDPNIDDLELGIAGKKPIKDEDEEVAEEPVEPEEPETPATHEIVLTINTPENWIYPRESIEIKADVLQDGMYVDEDVTVDIDDTFTVGGIVGNVITLNGNNIGTGVVVVSLVDYPDVTASIEIEVRNEWGDW